MINQLIRLINNVDGWVVLRAENLGLLLTVINKACHGMSVCTGFITRRRLVHPWMDMQSLAIDNTAQPAVLLSALAPFQSSFSMLESQYTCC